MDVRRNIDEIIAIYQFEETVRDVYVEGERDKSFFKWLIKAGVESDSEVYSANDIDIHDELLVKYNLPLGSNRYRVAAASMAVSEAIPNSQNALFIIDRDYSEYISEEIETKLLRLTDYNSIELYAMNKRAIGKIMAIAYGCYSTTPPNFYIEMKLILRRIYTIRLSNIKLGWNMSWLDFNKFVKVNQSVIFLEEKFIESYLNKNSKWSQRSEFYQILEICTGELNSDCRLSVRGHDFTQLLLHILNKKIKTSKIDNITPFEGFLIATLDRSELLEEVMINEVFEFSRLASSL